MPDFTKCVNDNCSVRFKCERFIAFSDSIRQSYTFFDEKNCTMFREVKNMKKSSKNTKRMKMR